MFLGWLILIVASPITSSMVKYYEKTKSQYARDIDHLVTFNKNGLWIKENLDGSTRIITASKPEELNLINVTIFQLNENYNLEEKIYTNKAYIKNNEWELSDVLIFKPKNGIFEKQILKNFQIRSIYNHDKITSLFKNFLIQCLF